MSKILLVDDDTDMLAMTGRWLEKAGYEVTKAESGAQALTLAAAEKPDLILLDVYMPEMDGPETLKKLKETPETANIPVLFRTGMEDTDLEEACSPYRAEGFVPKSEGKPTLMNAVAAALS